MALTTSELFNFVQGSDITGESSYDVWKSLNPNGTEQEFLSSIRGQSAYDLWLQQPGNEGKTEEDFNSALNGVETHLNDKNNPHGTQLTHFGITATVSELNYINGVTSNIQTQLNNKAASSHGNHVPAAETANNAKFLRNDNTWQIVTPANIGAKPAESTTFNFGGNYIAVRTPERTSAQYYEFWDNNVGWADIKAREFYAGDGVNKVYHAGNKPTAADIGAAASSHNHSAANITSGTLGVARGGTGATSFTTDHALIGNGTSAVKTRAITNNTSSAVASGTNLTTCNTVNNHVVNRQNRTNSVNAANTSYTTFMSRGIALNTAVPSSLTNGCATFVYA